MTDKDKRITLEEFSSIGNKIMNSCKRARTKAKEKGDFSEIKKWNDKGIFIQDDDAESIDAEGFWKVLLKKLKEIEIKRDVEIELLDLVGDYLREKGWNPLIASIKGIANDVTEKDALSYPKKYNYSLIINFTGKKNDN